LSINIKNFTNINVFYQFFLILCGSHWTVRPEWSQHRLSHLAHRNGPPISGSPSPLEQGTTLIWMYVTVAVYQHVIFNPHISNNLSNTVNIISWCFWKKFSSEKVSYKTKQTSILNTYKFYFKKSVTHSKFNELQNNNTYLGK
jgi:hypothetical protein